MTDAATGVGLANARVDIPQWALTSTTDSTGRFTLSGVPDGRWVVRASAPGYATGLGTGGDIRLHAPPAVTACPVTKAVAKAVGESGGEGSVAKAVGEGSVAKAVVVPQITTTPSSLVPGSLVQLVVVDDSAMAVTATVLGQPVTFTRDAAARRFVGLAAVPLDSTHDAAVSLLYSYPSGAVAQTTAPLGITNPIAISAGPPRREALHVAPQFAARPVAATAHRIAAESELAHEVGTASLGTQPLWHEPFERPRPGRVTSPFGGGRKFNGTLIARHTGTDFAGQIGDPVNAANRGVVAMIGDFFLAGTVVYIDHGGGLTSAYFHLSSVDVAVGDTVQRGQRIGSVGATGRVTGPHLHWVVRYGTVSVDPMGSLALQVPPKGPVVPLCK